MSTTTYDAPLHSRGHEHGRDERPGLGRLTRVELRKMYDTRAGFWLLVCGALLTVSAVLVSILAGSESDHTLGDVLDNASQTVTVLLPIVGILLVTSEWSQRTAQLTFTLVPHRGRVLAAKASASTVLALIAFALVLACSLLATLLNPGVGDVWALSAGLLAQTALFIVVSMLIGVALGAAILLSAPAIVASFILPLGFSAVTHVISGLNGVGHWTDQSESLVKLTDHTLSGTEWARVATTLLLWLALPMAIGTVRFVRGEIR